MTETTPLDGLCAEPFATAPDPMRARILSRFADTALFAALEAEPAGDTVTFRVFDLAEGAFALAFDREERLADFIGGPASFIELPGRVLAGRLAEAETGLLLNPGHPSEMLLSAQTLGWLSQGLSQAPVTAAARAQSFGPPIVPDLIEPLAVRLADMAGLARAVWLVATRFPSGDGAGHLLLVEGADAAQEDRIAKALAEVLTFLPEVAGGVDVAFVAKAPAQVVQVGLRFDLPQLAPVQPSVAAPPGSDPDRPPRLR